MNHSEIMIPVKKTVQSRLVQEEILHADFGRIVSDHMLVADYKEGRWQEAEIVPFGEFMISPTALGLHYGQSIFEGMKAFRMKDGKVSIFRMEKHYQRFCRSLERMCMPHIPREHFVNGIRQLIAVDEAWVPNSEGASLYIRPFMFATEARFGMKISDEFRFIIFSGPVGPYYTKPLRVKVEQHFTRAAKGGTGAAKCAGNYGASFYPALKAKEEGYDQVLWTDGDAHEFIEESGTMNIMFMIDDVLLTPPLTDTILDGVTRDSLLQIAKDMGVKVQERKISYLELKQALEGGKKLEAFGAGTAAITAPIAVIKIDGVDYDVPPYSYDSFCVKAAKRLTEIRTGTHADKHGWNTVL